jgi:hypothetical protein
MIAALIRWSAKNLVLILIAATLAAGAGIYALRHVPLDAIPDLSDTQVIIYTEYSGQAPQVIEDQIIYPLSTAMLSVPKARVVRGFSFFGVSFVYVIFEDGTDIYWARSRVLEYLSAAARTLPAGVPSLWRSPRHSERLGPLLRNERRQQQDREDADDFSRRHLRHVGPGCDAFLRELVEDRRGENLLGQLVRAVKRRAGIALHRPQAREMCLLSGPRALGWCVHRSTRRRRGSRCDQERLAVVDGEPRFPLRVGDVDALLQSFAQWTEPIG